ncbi:MAG: T9SS type A sorting domain-containing protein [Bacteroidetes bacterium]|nr:T9SS type A sorting domain-containing protein [Bacteroidota bacterium]
MRKIQLLLLVFCFQSISDLRSQSTLPEISLNYSVYTSPSVTQGIPFFASYTKDSAVLDSIILSESYYTVYRTRYVSATNYTMDTFLLKQNKDNLFFTGKIPHSANSTAAYVQDKMIFDFSKAKGDTVSVNLNPSDAATSDRYLVDSVKYLKYKDGKAHKTIYYHWIENNYFQNSFQFSDKNYAMQGIGFSCGFIPINTTSEYQNKCSGFILQCEADTERYHHNIGFLKNAPFHYCGNDKVFRDSFFHLVSLGKKSFEKPQIKVFPNPSSSGFTIASVEEGTVYEIYSLTGAKLEMGTVKIGNIIGNNLPAGTFQLRVITQQGIVYSKLMVIRE